MNLEPHILVLDAGPLWELVLYQAVNELGFGRLRPELTHLSTEIYYDRLSRFIFGYPSRTTTPQVMAEISSKVMRTKERGQEDVWEVIYREFGPWAWTRN